MTASTSASASTKPRLTVLVGAGGSFELGVPLTDSLTTIVREAFDHPAPNFQNYFTDPEDAEKRRQLLLVAEQHYGTQLNFEQLFEFLESGLALHSGWRSPGGIAEAGWTQPRAELVSLFSSRNGYPEFLSHSRLMLELTVESSISGRSAAAPSSADWPLFQHFWAALASSFDLTVTTLNYDTLIEQALGWGGAEQGFEPADGSLGWVFHPGLVHERKKHRLLHLHGSILFKGGAYGDTVGQWNPVEGHWQNKWYPTIENARLASGGDLGRTGYGRDLLGGSMITGLHKNDKVHAEPFGTYYEATTNALRACPRLLVIGYGFGDPHINRLINRMTRDHGEGRRVACVDYVRLPDEIHCDDRRGFLEATHLWSERRLPWNDGASSSWVDMDGLWNAPGGRMQLHFHGFMKAARRADKLVDFLQS